MEETSPLSYLPPVPTSPSSAQTASRVIFLKQIALCFPAENLDGSLLPAQYCKKTPPGFQNLLPHDRGSFPSCPPSTPAKSNPSLLLHSFYSRHFLFQFSFSATSICCISVFKIEGEGFSHEVRTPPTLPLQSEFIILSYIPTVICLYLSDNA